MLESQVMFTNLYYEFKLQATKKFAMFFNHNHSYLFTMDFLVDTAASCLAVWSLRSGKISDAKKSGCQCKN